VGLPENSLQPKSATLTSLRDVTRRLALDVLSESVVGWRDLCGVIDLFRDNQNTLAQCRAATANTKKG
jgi:hypothetical protein